MKRRKHWSFLLGVISAMSLIMAVGMVSAQSESDETTPLLQMFELVPDEMHGDLYFNDYQAIEQAYAPAQAPADWAEFDALSADTAEEMYPVDVWWRVFMNTLSPVSQYFMRSAEMPAVMGIDFFQIDRTLINMAPPHTVTYLQGEFHVDAIRSALTERGFSQQPASDDLELWCGAVGCENSSRVDPSNTVPADLFGGDLGRQWARIISPNLLIGANIYEDLQDVAATVAGEASSLADDGRHRAAVEAVSDQGVLLQALIPSVQNTLSFYDFAFMIDPRLTAEQYAAIMDAYLEDFETLPAFDLIMFADIVSETEQIAQVVLVYSSAEAAEQAIPVLLDRIESYQSIMYRRPLADLIEQRHAAVTADVITIDNWSVVRLKLATPKATPEEIVEFTTISLTAPPPDVTMPGQVYRLLPDGYFSRDLGWLSLITREELETLASDS